MKIKFDSLLVILVIINILIFRSNSNSSVIKLNAEEIPAIYLISQISDAAYSDNNYLKAQEFKTLSKYDSAIHYFEKALTGYTQNKDTIKIISCTNNLSECLLEISEYDRAIQHLDNIYMLLDNNLEDGYSYLLLGQLYLKKGNYKKAITFYNRSHEKEKTKAPENNILLARIYHGIGLCFKYLSDYNQALSYLKKSHSIVTNNNKFLIIINNALGSTYYKLNDFDQAIIYYKKARAIQLNELGEKNISSIHYYNNIGGILSAKGEYDLAIEKYNKALTIGKEILENYNPNLAISYLKKGIAYKRMGNYNQAIFSNDSALKVLKIKLGMKHKFAAMAFNNKGNIYLELKEIGKAIENYKKALEIKKNLYGEKHPQISSSYHNIAELYIRDKKYKKALNYYQKAIQTNTIEFNNLDPYENPVLGNTLDKKYLLISLTKKGTAFLEYFNSVTHNVSELKAALKTFSLASDLLEDIRINFAQEGSKLLLADISNEIYRKATECSYQLYQLTNEFKYKEQSYLFSEKNKVAVLYESVLDANAKKFSDIPDSLIYKENELKKNIISLETKINRSKLKKGINDIEETNNIENQYFALKSKHQNLIEEIEIMSPKYYQMKFQKSIISSSELQQGLENNTVIIEYLFTNSSMFILSISKDEYHISKILLDSSFYNVLSRYINNIKKRSIIKKSNKEQFIKDSHWLYSQLIKPINSKIMDYDRLIIISEGKSTFLPFESLIIKPDILKGFNKQQYLINKFSISYHHSATFFHQNKQNANSFSKDSFIGFAPVFFENNRNNNLISTNRSILDTSNINFSLDAIEERGNKFNYLPESESELIGISKIFNKYKYSKTIYLHNDASEENFKAIKNSKFLHIATHSFFNEDNPQLSGLALSQPLDTLSEEDGILYSNEIYNLNVESDLVVLSSCESGSGKLLNGEGIMSITRGFLYNGIPNIVYTLWKISDKHTNYLMLEFYKNILLGNSYAASLRKAKLKMIKDESMSLPFYWSAFLMIGS